MAPLPTKIRDTIVVNLIFISDMSFAMGMNSSRRMSTALFTFLSSIWLVKIRFSAAKDKAHNIILFCLPELRYAVITILPTLSQMSVNPGDSSS